MMRHRYGRNHREREMAQSYFYKDVLPFSAMLAAECTTVVYKILFKEATLKGLSNYVFNAYSYAVSTLVLLPVVFIFSRRSELPTLELPLLYRIFLLGVIGVVSQICGYKGIEYSSPTLASAIGNLTPAFTFILAAVFRMENVALRSSSAQAKITGTVVSISGALVVVLYDGPTLIPASSRLLGSSQKNWVLGGLLLAVEYLLCSIWYIIQTQVMTIYPSETIVVFLYNLWGTIISAVVCLMAERSLSAWSLKPDISLVAILYSGVALSFITVVHTWGLHLKGPVYISIFRPFSIVIAAALSVTFLGEALYLGSVVGAILISVGFYGVMWGKAKEEEEKMSEEYGFGSLAPSSPLLERYNVEDK